METKLPIKYTALTQVEILEQVKRLIPSLLPEWTDDSDTDFGIVVLREGAVQGDILANRQDIVYGESHLSTCQQRQSALYFARTSGYTVRESSGASVTLKATVTGIGTIPQYSDFYNQPAVTEDRYYFENLVEVEVEAADVVLGYKEFSITAGRTIEEEDLGVSTGYAFQQFETRVENYIHNSMRFFKLVGETLEEWTLVENFVNSSATDTDFVVITDKDSKATIITGAGSAGLIPTIGSTMKATYRVDGGKDTNIPASKIINFDTSLTFISSVTNELLATGGTDKETLEELKNNIPNSLYTLERAVSTPDYEYLMSNYVGTTGTIKRCFIYDADGMVLHCYLIGEGGAVVSTALKNEIDTYMLTVKQIKDTLEYKDMQTIRLLIEIDVVCRDSVVQDSVEENIRNVLGTDEDVVGFAYYNFDNLMNRYEHTDLELSKNGGDPYYSCHDSTLVSILKDTTLVTGVQSLSIKKLTIAPKDTLAVYVTGDSNLFITWSEIVVGTDSLNMSYLVIFDLGTVITFTVYKLVSAVKTSVGTGELGTAFVLDDTNGDFTFTLTDDENYITIGDSYIFKTMPYLEDIGTLTNKINTAIEKAYVLQLQDSSDDDELTLNMSGGI